MTVTKEIQFSLNDVIKLCGFIIVVGGMWYDLKTSFAVHLKSHELLEYRMASMEKKLLATTSYKPFAIVPKETKIEDEN